MRKKFTFYSVLLILTIALSACGVNASPVNQPIVRTINVTGSAQSNLVPDVAYIAIGVQTQNDNATQAMSGNNTLAQQVMDAIKALGVDAKDIRTTSFNIYPSQQYDQNNQLTGTIFVVDNTVSVTLRDLQKIGDIVGAAVTAGANNINSIQFDVLDKSTALTDARKAAVADAHKQATELAAAAGVILGDVQSISFSNNYPISVPMADNKTSSIRGDSVPISTGQLTITVDVNVVYEIK
jgi:uncharacterized protein YggE